jgi:copper chaperone
METITLDVQGMSCNHCVKAIEESVGEQKGVDAVNVDLEEGKVEVRFDAAQISKEQIAEAIEEQGYDVVKSYSSPN